MKDNLYFFYGDEDYLLDERIRQIAAELGEGVSIETLGAKEAAEKLGELVSAQSLFSEKRLLVIRDQQVFTDKELAEEIPRFLSSIPSAETVIFVAKGHPDGRKKLTAWLKKEAQVEEFRNFAPWQEEEALAFIVREVKRNGKKIGSHAAGIFWEMAGANLRHLSSEINKVATYVGEQEVIEKQDILAVISAGEADVFAFVESLRRRDEKTALRTLVQLLKEKENPVGILGLLASQFRMLLQVKSLQEEGKDAYQIGAILKTKPFFVKKTLEKSGYFSLAELKNILSLILNADYHIKIGYPPQNALEELVLGICEGEI